MLARHPPQCVGKLLIHAHYVLSLLAINQSMAEADAVDKPDANKEALEQVERITDSSRDNGEDLLESDDLKHQLREARERVGLPKPSRQEPIE
jgi:phytoene/squalene synthetase